MALLPKQGNWVLIEKEELDWLKQQVVLYKQKAEYSYVDYKQVSSRHREEVDDLNKEINSLQKANRELRGNKTLTF